METGCLFGIGYVGVESGLLLTDYWLASLDVLLKLKLNEIIYNVFDGVERCSFWSTQIGLPAPAPLKKIPFVWMKYSSAHKLWPYKELNSISINKYLFFKSTWIFTPNPTLLTPIISWILVVKDPPKNTSALPRLPPRYAAVFSVGGTWVVYLL